VSRQRGGATRHWRNQRMTSIALLPLGLWFVIALLRQPDLDYATVTGWLAKPMQALLALLFGIAMLWHSLQGVQVVLEDYVGGSLRGNLIRISQIIHGVLAVALLSAILRLVSGSGA
jgi:succinate dehydrogenase / fumarate reductase, membrane anchor subunit